MKDKYILDSSIWIEMERNNPKIIEIVQPLLQKNQVCLVDVIVAEVLRGTRTKKDYQTLQRAFQDFNQLSASWELVAEMGFVLGQGGVSPPLIDLYIANCALENKKTVVTQDRHFRQIAKFYPLEIMMVGL